MIHRSMLFRFFTSRVYIILEPLLANGFYGWVVLWHTSSSFFYACNAYYMKKNWKIKHVNWIMQLWIISLFCIVSVFFFLFYSLFLSFLSFFYSFFLLCFMFFFYYYSFFYYYWFTFIYFIIFFFRSYLASFVSSFLFIVFFFFNLFYFITWHFFYFYSLSCH